MDLDPENAQRRLAAIMFSDIVGYTALMAESEQRALRARETHRELLGGMAARYGGRIVDENGDELVLIFRSGLDAVNCALAAQTELSADPDLTLRIGVHSGDVVLEGGRIYGDGVNVASRIRPLAEPGGIAVSDQVYDSIKNQASIETAGLGQQDLKNVDRPVAAFAVSGAPSASGAPPVIGSPRRLRPTVWASAIAILLAVVAGAAWLLRGPAARDGPIRSIAVLPFVNMAAEPGGEHFSDGITEEIITALSKLKTLEVASRSATFLYKARAVDPREIGRDLDVAAILEGSVRRDGDRIRITAQLIKVDDGFHLWSQNYDRHYEAILDIQADVAREIAQALRLSLTKRDVDALGRRATDSVQAYEHYTRARHAFYTYTQEGNAAAIDLYQEALKLDGRYAPALAGLSLAYSQFISQGWSGDPEWLSKAETFARRSLEVDPNLAEAHFALGFVHQRRELEDETEAAMRATLALNPNHAHAHDTLGDIYLFRGQLEEALAAYATALRLDPTLTPALLFSARVRQYKGQYREALRMLEEALEGPSRRSNHWDFDIGWGLSHQGRHAEAAERFRISISRRQSFLPAHLELARTLMALDDLDGAAAAAERIPTATPAGERLADFTRALVAYARLGPSGAPVPDALPGGVFGPSWRAFRFDEVAIAELQLDLGEGAAAASRFESILRNAPFNLFLRSRLAAALEQAGETDRAIKEYRAFVKSWKDADPDAPALVLARQRLAALESPRALAAPPGSK